MKVTRSKLRVFSKLKNGKKATPIKVPLMKNRKLATNIILKEEIEIASGTHKRDIILT